MPSLILNKHSNQRIRETLDKALNEHPRTLVIRIDLYLPDITFNADSTQMTRFIASLNAQIDADIQKRRHAGARVHSCTLRFVWTREFHQEGRKHYHLALFLNKDTYAYAGAYHADEDGEYTHNLSVMIMEAWVRTLKLHEGEQYQQHYTLINFSGNCYNHLNKNKMDFTLSYSEELSRLSYLAKEYSKKKTDGQRNFGCSQR